jgi:sirohydrochlorin cobaltochelatase
MKEDSTDRDSGDEELAALEAKINELLPPRYVGCFEDVSPSSMGSAGLRYDAQGRVAWGEIWTTFCHLALAGGPPHRGRLLGPVAAEDVRSAPEAYEAVVAELERALGLCVDLPLVPTRQPGWIGLKCEAGATAGWLVRAIVAENVIARHEGTALYVPAGPGFRIEKEIKNVVVCVAKTCHYLFDHLEPEQQPTGAARPLVGPPLPHEIAAAGERYEAAATSLQEIIRQATGLATSLGEAPGWVGVSCESEEAAVWMLRAVAVEDVLVRREEATLYVPVDVNPDGEGGIARTAAAVVNAHRLWGRHVNKTGAPKNVAERSSAKKN